MIYKSLDKFIQFDYIAFTENIFLLYKKKLISNKFSIIIDWLFVPHTRITVRPVRQSREVNGGGNRRRRRRRRSARRQAH